MKKLTFALLAAALAFSGINVANACDQIAASASCSPVSLNPNTETWIISWNDTGCSCDVIKLYVKDDCSGSWTLISDSIACSVTSHAYAAPAGDLSFKIERWYNGAVNQTAETFCKTCD